MPDPVVAIFLGKTNRFPGGRLAAPVDLPEGATSRGAFYGKLAGKTLSLRRADWAKTIFSGGDYPPNEVANSANTKMLNARNPKHIGGLDERDIGGRFRLTGVIFERPGFGAE